MQPTLRLKFCKTLARKIKNHLAATLMTQIVATLASRDASMAVDADQIFQTVIGSNSALDAKRKRIQNG